MPFAYLVAGLISLSAFAQTPTPEFREAFRDLETLNSVNRMSEIEDVVRSLNQQDCAENNEAFLLVNSGIPVACGSGTSRDGYEETRIMDCTRDNREYPSGFRFRAQHENPFTADARSPYANGSKPGRMIEFVSRNHALNETYLYMSDTAGGPDSHDQKSVMFLLPRSVIPSVQTIGNEVHVTMSTGEKVVFDKRTNQIKSGALREGPLDLTADRFRRQPPNVQYSGTGVSIKLSHRFEDPLQFTETAEVKQGSRSCRVPRATLLDTQGKLKTQNDRELMRVLNQSCPSGTGQSPFRI